MKADNFRGQVLQNVMPQKIDQIDQKILYLLSQNCRFSNTALARSLKIKREVVAYRINQLVQKKLITGFLTLLDQRKIGLMTFSVYLKLTTVDEEKPLIEYLISKKEVTCAGTCSGRYDIHFDVTTRTMEEFETIINQFLKKYSPVIKEHVILNFLRQDPMGNNIIFNDSSLNKQLDISETKGSTFSKEFAQQRNPANLVKLDNVDKKILASLRFKARATLRDLAKEVKISPKAVKSRVSSLASKEVIKCFIPLISFSALGYQWFMVLLNLAGVNESKLYRYAQQHPNIEWCVKYIGPWNYQLSIFAKDNCEFHKVLNEIRNEFKENIIHFDSIIVFNQFKFESRVE